MVSGSDCGKLSGVGDSDCVTIKDPIVSAGNWWPLAGNGTVFERSSDLTRWESALSVDILFSTETKHAPALSWCLLSSVE